MSTYAISDLHGYPVEKFKALLAKAGFCDDDTLYILGDVIDRNGDGGVSLLRLIMESPNMEFILGNHEDMLLKCEFLFEEVTDESINKLTADSIKFINHYLLNGGGVTIENLLWLRRKTPDALPDILQFLHDAPAYAAATVNGRDYLLVHAGLGGFAPDKKLKDYPLRDIIWERPTLETEFFDDITTVFGHTPTLYYGEEYRGKVLFTRTWINIDAGAAEGLPPALLRLDDNNVFYGD